MDLNLTASNNTFIQVIKITNATMDTVNSANNTVVPVKDLYEDYIIVQRHKFLVYKAIAYVLATLIILSNLSVVISSGLILKKGQKPKSTYLLLGNVSLADTIVGFSIIFGLSIDYTLNTDPMCIFQTGILVAPAMVSIFSVGLIAVDRYIYILHGLYYQRWFNTTRVRIGIVLIWIISLSLSFVPVTGWINPELAHTRCIYVGLFPGEIILVNSILSIIPIVVVVVLYTFILVKALKTVKTINNTIKIKEVSPTKEDSQIRINRRTFNARTQSLQSAMNVESNGNAMRRSASFNFGTNCNSEYKNRTKSTDNLSDVKANLGNLEKDVDNQSKIHFESDFSVSTVESVASMHSSSIDNTNYHKNQLNKSMNKPIRTRKIKEPNKWRAVKVVMLTTACLIFSWIPFFVTVIFYVNCEEKLTNPECIKLRALLGGPLAILAFINSIVNPLIYAWWHKGFQTSARNYYKQYLHKYICPAVSPVR